MSVKINFYRSLSHEEVNQLNANLTLTYYYLANGERNPLKSTDDGQFVSVESQDGEWNSDNYGIGIKCDITLEKATKLFDSDGIAYDHSDLGISILWNSVDSKKKGVIGRDLILRQDSKQSFTFEKYFKQKTFHGSIELEIVIVLLKESSKNNNLAINNTPGIQLGILGSKVIKLDGSGSIFPIINISNKQGTLWNMVMDYNDPSVDMFCDVIRIELNTAHKDYKFIDLKDKGNCCNRLINEIVSNSIIELFLKLRLDGYLNSVSNQSFSDGSVLQVAKYLIETKGFLTDTVESISDSIMKYFETKGV